MSNLARAVQEIKKDFGLLLMREKWDEDRGDCLLGGRASATRRDVAANRTDRKNPCQGNNGRG